MSTTSHHIDRRVHNLQVIFEVMFCISLSSMADGPHRAIGYQSHMLQRCHTARLRGLERSSYIIPGCSRISSFYCDASSALPQLANQWLDL